jgi:hypothetical protein
MRVYILRLSLNVLHDRTSQRIFKVNQGLKSCFLFASFFFPPEQSRPLAMPPVPDLEGSTTISIVNSSSSRGHKIDLSCEASGLLSSDQLHHASTVQDQDATTIVDYENGRQTSLSPVSSNPNSIREIRDAGPTSPGRAIHWKTVGVIIGFLFAG